MGIDVCSETLISKENINGSYCKRNECKLIPRNVQYIGKRKEQQDSFGFSDAESYEDKSSIGVIAVIADGMGGMMLGKEVSQFSVKSMLEGYLEKDEEEKVEEALMRALHCTNEKIVELGKSNRQEGNVGTTLVAAVVAKGKLHWISVGDSRLYLIRGDRVICLTSDHIYCKDLFRKVEAGQLSMDKAMKHPEKAALTSYIGLEVLEDIEKSRDGITIGEGDKILLCSDGFYNSLEEKDILEAMKQSEEKVLDILLDQIINKDLPHQDNATAIMLCVSCK